MERKKLVEIGVVCVLFLVLAWYVEQSDYLLDKEKRIVRNEPGDGAQEVSLTLGAKGLFEGYEYPLTVQERALTEEEAQACFARAREEIDAGFYAEGETAGHVTQDVHMADSYAGGLVTAEWVLDDYRYIGVNGRIEDEEIPEEGSLVGACAKLSCGKYNLDYNFSFLLCPREHTEEEALLDSVETALMAQQEQEGAPYLVLPESVNGYRLYWEETRRHLVPKVLFFEVVILILLHFVRRERARESERLRREEMRLDYAEVVNKLLILMGAGMSLKQAWNRISAQYEKKRNEGEAVRHIYEEMAHASHEMEDGVSERLAYQHFGERTGLGEYNRLVRILLQNLQTGSRGLSGLLEREAQNALEERMALAKKLGEEAGTKLLLPMTLMLGIVIAIIMVPAMLSFQI